MKFAANILSRFSRSRAEEPDAFDLRLVNMGTEAKKTVRSIQPNLFIRTARQAA